MVLPRFADVFTYWAPRLAAIGKELNDAPHTKDGRTQASCFACGHTRPVDRAHIKARLEGGDDSVQNIHLLCRFCHQLSETMAPGHYARWFRECDPQNHAFALGLLLEPALADSLLRALSGYECADRPLLSLVQALHPPAVRGNVGRPRSYTPEQAARARALLADGVPHRRIARTLRLSPTTVRRIAEASA